MDEQELNIRNQRVIDNLQIKNLEYATQKGKLKVICILQNAWGSKWLPYMFQPNEGNKSARTIRKKVLTENDVMHFCNTTGVITETATGKPKPDPEHFKEVMGRLSRYDLIIVCGKQAEETVKGNLETITALEKHIIYMPHPASRSLSNIQLLEIKERVDLVREELKKRRWAKFKIDPKNISFTAKELSDHDNWFIKSYDEFVTKMVCACMGVPYSMIKPTLRPIEELMDDNSFKKQYMQEPVDNNPEVTITNKEGGQPDLINNEIYVSVDFGKKDSDGDVLQFRRNTITGLGGDIIVIDDPYSEDNQPDPETVNKYYEESILSRVAPIVNGILKADELRKKI